LGYLDQDGLLNTFNTDYSFNYGYQRYNYRANIDLDMTKSTKFSLTMGGISGLTQAPANTNVSDVWTDLYWAVPIQDRYTRGNVLWSRINTLTLRKNTMDLGLLVMVKGIPEHYPTS